MHPGSPGVVGAASLAAVPQTGASRGAEPAAPQQSRMESFRKVKTSEEESPLPFAGLPSDVIEMKVKEGSKIRNLMGFAVGRVAREETRQIVFSGCGRAVTKTITCVEILKRKVRGLHQVTKVQYRTVLEVWESKAARPEGAPAEHLTVHKNVPSVCILLSKDPLDPSQMGYQPPDLPGGLRVGEGGSQEDSGASSAPKERKRRLAPPPPPHEEAPRSKKIQDDAGGLGGGEPGRPSRPTCLEQP